MPVSWHVFWLTHVPICSLTLTQPHSVHLLRCILFTKLKLIHNFKAAWDVDTPHAPATLNKCVCNRLNAIIILLPWGSWRTCVCGGGCGGRSTVDSSSHSWMTGCSCKKHSKKNRPTLSHYTDIVFNFWGNICCASHSVTFFFRDFFSGMTKQDAVAVHLIHIFTIIVSGK